MSKADDLEYGRLAWNRAAEALLAGDLDTAQRELTDAWVGFSEGGCPEAARAARSRLREVRKQLGLGPFPSERVFSRKED